jgi:hypothetical protein
MKKTVLSVCCILFFLAFSIPGLGLEKPGTSLTLADLIAKNIEAAGGKTKIDRIKYITFTVPHTRLKEAETIYYAASTGVLKVVGNIKNLIPRTIIVTQDGIKIADFSRSLELNDLEKVKLECFAKIFAGAFTLGKFEKGLTLKGLKRYGPEKFYLIKGTFGNHTVSFYINADDYLLKRVLFEGFDDIQGTYKSTSAFGNYIDIQGVKMPSTWFESYLGTAYSNINKEQKIMDIKINQEPAKGFFNRLDVNFGEVSAGKGSLKGNIIDSQTGSTVVIMTVNWTDEIVKQTGFKSGDRLLVQFAGEKYEAVYIPDFYSLSNEDLAKDVIYVVKAPGYPYWWIFFRGVKYKPVAKNFKLLLPVSVLKVNQ